MQKVIMQTFVPENYPLFLRQLVYLYSDILILQSNSESYFHFLRGFVSVEICQVLIKVTYYLLSSYFVASNVVFSMP